MRRALVAAALAVASVPVTATAFPPHCEKYADKPCFTFCEIYQDIEPLFDPTPVSGC